jgi:putative endonuclease
MWNVYIIKSSVKKWYYVGSTNRLDIRMKEHNAGKVTSSKSYKPFDLIFKKEFDLETDARNYERFLKDNRIEKEKIVKEFESK